MDELRNSERRISSYAFVGNMAVLLELNGEVYIKGWRSLILFTGRSRPFLYRQMKRNGFPSPYRHIDSTGHRYLWKQKDVLVWTELQKCT